MCALRVVFGLLLLLWALAVEVYLKAKEHGVTYAVLLFAFLFLTVEMLFRGDQGLRHRMGVTWVSRVYVTVASAFVAAFFIAIWWVLR